MAIELRARDALPKPWGVADLRPFGRTRHDGKTIGEIWFERPETPALTIRRFCLSCCSPASHFPFRFIRTTPTRSQSG